MKLLRTVVIQRKKGAVKKHISIEVPAVAWYALIYVLVQTTDDPARFLTFIVNLAQSLSS